MSNKLAVIISPNWQDYAAKYLAACLTSLAKQDYQGEWKIFLIDNGSTEISRALINKIAREKLGALSWRLVVNENNDGFAKGNNEAIKIALAEGYDYIALFNMDGRLASECLTNLVRTMARHETVGAAQAKMLLWPDKDKINSLGNVTHFLGFGYCDGYGQKATESVAKEKDIIYPSGAAVILRATALKRIGLFDEEFWMYNEDQDLGWRLWLNGWRVVLVPEAIFYHEYEFNRSAKKYYWLDRNRLLSIFKNYRLPTLLLITPALLLMELGHILAAGRGGWLKEKLQVWFYFLRPATWRYLIKARRQAQSLRRAPDRQIVKMFSGRILYQEINSPLLRGANVFFAIYWHLVKILILW